MYSVAKNVPEGRLLSTEGAPDQRDNRGTRAEPRLM
jgi:hypothetical protein